MPAIQLTPAQRKEHRAAAHHLHPVVTIGSDGLTSAVRNEIDVALGAHGLIKVRVFSDDRVARSELLESLASELGAAPVQHIGKLFVLWRPPQERTTTPAEKRSAAPKEVKIVRFSKSGNHRPQIKRVTLLGNQRVAAGGEIKRSRPRKTSLKKAAQAS
jgi:putative YhbY family RNA-binding protein